MTDFDFALKEYSGFDYIYAHAHPASAYGRKALRQLRPFAPTENTALGQRLDNIETTLRFRPRFVKAYARMVHVLGQMRDIRGSLRRCLETTLDEVELFEIKRFALQLRALRGLLGEIGPDARYTGLAFRDAAPVLDILDPEGGRVGAFYLGGAFSAALAEIRAEKGEVEKALRAEEGNAELLERRRDIARREQAEELAVRERLTLALRPHMEALLEDADMVAELDLVLAFAALAEAGDCCRPEIGAEKLTLRGARHPGIAEKLGGRSFVPLDIEMTQGVTVLTGANMGGKSVALKTVAFNALLMRCGIYPFAERACCPDFFRISALSGDLERASDGLSSFGGEIVAFARALESPGFSLLLLDEFAKGTNPEEGAAIVAGVAEYLRGYPACALLATHYDGVAAYANAHYQVRGLRDFAFPENEGMSVGERVAEIAKNMDYGLVRVENEAALPREALRIAKYLGLPQDILAMIEKRY